MLLINMCKKLVDFLKPLRFLREYQAIIVGYILKYFEGTVKIFLSVIFKTYSFVALRMF